MYDGCGLDQRLFFSSSFSLLFLIFSSKFNYFAGSREGRLKERAVREVTMEEVSFRLKQKAAQGGN